MAQRSRSKYGNVKTVVDGITFDSKAEATRYSELRMLEKAGKISKLTLQPAFVIITPGRDWLGKERGPIRYVADFAYYEDDEHVVEEVKGRATPLYKLKARLFRAQYPDKVYKVIRV